MIQKTTVDIFTSLLDGGSPFSFSRWNDGHWNMVLGKVEGRTGDGHRYAKEIGDDLRRVLTDRPKYMLGLQGLSMRGTLGRKVEAWIQEHELEDLSWYDADVFHKANADNTMGPMIQRLEDMSVLAVGPEHLKKLPFVSHFVSIPFKDAYYSRSSIREEVISHLSSAELVLLSAGWTSNLLIHELYPTSESGAHSSTLDRCGTRMSGSAVEDT